MAKEYVYKIVVDDSDVDKTIDSIDSKVQVLAQRMDRAFKDVGKGSAQGVTSAASQVEQVSRRVQQSEQQTSRVVVDSQRRTAQAVEQSQNQQTQAVVRSAQQQLSAAREVTRARQEEAQAAQQSSAVARESADEAARAAQLRKRALEDASAAAKAAAEAQKQAANELRQAEKEGATAGIEALKERKAAADENVSATVEAENSAKEAYVESQRAAQDASNTAKEAARDRTEASRSASVAVKNERAAEKELTTTTAALARQKRDMAKAERDTERAFVKTVKTFGSQRNELNRLAKEHGSFNIVVGKTTGELTELEQQVEDVIRSDKKLSDEIDKLTAKQGAFNVAVDRSTFAGGPPEGLQSGQLRQAGFAAQRLGIPGAAALGEAAAVGGAAGIVVAGVILSVTQLIKLFKNLAGAAKDAFDAIVSGAVAAAAEIDTAGEQFTAFFQGDIAASEATIKRLRDLSQELGENVIGVGRAFLPEVESLDQLEQMVKLAAALARYQPEQGITGARIALQEALGGEFRSLERRFEINPIAIDRIREAFQAGGVTGLLQELQTELERTGRSVDDLSDTFSVSVGRIRERWNQFLQDLGDPIVETLKDELGAIDEELANLDPNLDAVAALFGDIVTKLVELVGVEIGDFIEEFDPEAIFAVLEALNALVGSLGVFVASVGGGATSANLLEAALYTTSGALLNLEGFLLRSSLEIARFREHFIGLLPVLEATQKGLAGVGNFAQDGSPIQNLAKIGLGATGLPAAFLEAGSTLEDTEAAYAAYLERLDQFPDSLEAFVSSLENSNEAGERAADVYLQMTGALQELQTAQKKYAELQAQVNDVVDEFNIEAQLRFEKILLEAQRNRIDFEIEAAEKRIDIERKAADKIADIRTKNDNAITDAATNLSDREEDIIRDHNRDLIDLEADGNDKRLEEEQRYQDELERIRDRSNFQAFEAILANDAKLLRQIRRRQSFEEEQAKKDKDRNLRDIDKEIDDRRAKLDIALERELEDANIINQRKLRDLAINLERQLEAQEVARQRDLRDQAIAEKRKRAELTKSLNEQLEDYTTWWDEHNRVTAEKIAEDLDLLRQYVDDAKAILGELNELGVTIDPITGQPQRNFTPAPAMDTNTEGMEDIQNRVLQLLGIEDILLGSGRTQAGREGFVESLGIEGLVAELERLQTSFNTLQVDPEKFIETTNLAQQLLMEQAVSIGEQAGLSAQEVIDQTLGLSMPQLSAWIDDFIEKYSVPDLPELTGFGIGDVLSQPGPTSGGFGGFNPFGDIPPAGMSQLPGAAPAGGTGGVPDFNPFGGGNFTAGGLLGPNPAFGFDADAYQDQLDTEVAATVAAELLKRNEIEETLTAAERYALNKARAIEAGLDEETAAQVAAGIEQILQLREQETESLLIKAESREEDLEAGEEHVDNRLNQLATGFEGEADLLNDFWQAWLQYERQGIVNDIKLLQTWIEQRNQLIQQAMANMPGGGMLPGGGTLPSNGAGGGTGGTQANIGQLQNLAISQATELGILTPVMHGDILDMAYDELVDFIEWLQGQLGSAAVGGSTQPGQPMLVGELGTEMVRMGGSTAFIDPIRSLLFRNSPPVGISGQTVNNEMNLGGFNFPDPRGLPPTYIKMMEIMAANMIRRAWGGRIR